MDLAGTQEAPPAYGQLAEAGQQQAGYSQPQQQTEADPQADYYAPQQADQQGYEQQAVYEQQGYDAGQQQPQFVNDGNTVPEDLREIGASPPYGTPDVDISSNRPMVGALAKTVCGSLKITPDFLSALGWSLRDVIGPPPR